MIVISRSTGTFFYTIERGGVIIERGYFSNGVTDAALTDMLNTYFRSATQKPTWYMFLIGATGYTALAPADTMSSHTGWTENTDYTESPRPTWAADAALNKSIRNSTTPAIFTMSAATTLKGIGIVSNSTKAGATGMLWCTGLFGSDRNLAISDVLRVEYITNLVN